MPVTSSYTPSAEGTNAWTNPSNARTHDSTPATAAPAKNSSIAGAWKTFGITEPSGAGAIAKVEVGIDWYVSTSSSKCHMGFQASYDNGSNWTTEVTALEAEVEGHLADGGDVHWFDCTGGRTWTWSELSDSYFQARVTAYRDSSSTAVTFNLDVVYVRITYGLAVVQTDTVTLSPEDITVTKTKAMLVTDTVSLGTELVLAGKSIAQTDAVSVTDIQIVNKPVALTDGVSLSDSPLINKSVIMSDSLGLSEALLGDKDLLRTDTVGLLDEVIVEVGAVLKTVEDTVTLDDQVLIDKVIQILDSIALTDIEIITGNEPPTPEPTPEAQITHAPPKRRRAKRIIKPVGVQVFDFVTLRDEVFINISNFVAADNIVIADDRVRVNKILTITDAVHLNDYVRIHKRIILEDAVKLADLALKDMRMDGMLTRIEQLEAQLKAMEGAKQIRYQLAVKKKQSIANRLKIKSMRDPAMMNSLIKNYEQKLVEKFNKFKRELPGAIEFKSAKETSYGVPIIKNLADRTIDTKATEANVRTLVIEVVISPSESLTKTQSAQAYKSGQKRGNQFLKVVGVVGEQTMTHDDSANIEALQTRNLSNLRGITDEMSKQIMSEITTGVLNGESIPEISKAINERVDAIGITRARLLARTETMMAANAGLVSQYEKADIEAVEWLTAWDERVCEECEALNGRTWPIADSPEIPAHPDCRCVLLPVVRGMEQPGEPEREPTAPPEVEPEPEPTETPVRVEVPVPAPPGIVVEELKPGVVVGKNSIGLSDDIKNYAPKWEKTAEVLLGKYLPDIRTQTSEVVQIDWQTLESRLEQNPYASPSATGYYSPNRDRIVVMEERLKESRTDYDFFKSIYRDVQNEPSGNETQDKDTIHAAIDGIADSYKTVYHEFAHSLDFGKSNMDENFREKYESMDGDFDGMQEDWKREYDSAKRKADLDYLRDPDTKPDPRDYMTETGQGIWDTFVSQRAYAKKKYEFWSVSFSNYCVQPWKMKEAAPELYEAIKERMGGWESPWLKWYEDGEIPEEVLEGD